MVLLILCVFAPQQMVVASSRVPRRIPAWHEAQQGHGAVLREAVPQAALAGRVSAN